MQCHATDQMVMQSELYVACQGVLLGDYGTVLRNGYILKGHPVM